MTLAMKYLISKVDHVTVDITFFKLLDRRYLTITYFFLTNQFIFFMGLV